MIPRQRFLAPAALVAAFSCPAGAQSPPPCFPHDAVAQTLAEQHREKRAVSALSERGYVIELYTSEAGSWTLVLVTSAGVACLVDAGTGLQIDRARIGAPT